MTAPLFEFVVYRPRLIFCDVIEYTQAIFLRFVEGCVQFVCDHFVCTALERKQFTLKIISTWA